MDTQQKLWCSLWTSNKNEGEKNHDFRLKIIEKIRNFVKESRKKCKFSQRIVEKHNKVLHKNLNLVKRSHKKTQFWQKIV